MGFPVGPSNRYFISLLLLVMCMAPVIEVQAAQDKNKTPAPVVEAAAVQDKNKSPAPVVEAAAGQDKNKTPAQKPAEIKSANKFIHLYGWGKTSQIPHLLNKEKITADQIPSPHWRGDACLACHSKAGKQASAKNTRSMKKGATCLNWHDTKIDHSYTHPVDIKPDANMQRNISKQLKQSLKKTGGEITCVTCHDLTLQCLSEKKKERGFNPKFFRGGPFMKRTEQCYSCHDAKEYQQLNPHDQIDDKGKIRDSSCRTCHAGSISLLKEGKSTDPVEFHAKKDLKTLCWGCHRWIPHPGGGFSFFAKRELPAHLGNLRQDQLDRLEQRSKEYNILFPLEPETGRIYCATCHNPHEKGVIKNAAAAAGADERKRLRTDNICPVCHVKSL